MIPIYRNHFKKDLKRVKKRGKNTDKLKLVIELLLAEQALPERCRDHLLVGNYGGRRGCHIEPDWLLIYVIKGNELYLERTGSHADLFQ